MSRYTSITPAAELARSAALSMIRTCSWPCDSAASAASCALPSGKWKYTEPRGAALRSSTSEIAVA
jgi:hypothetical protein